MAPATMDVDSVFPIVFSYVHSCFPSVLCSSLVLFYNVNAALHQVCGGDMNSGYAFVRNGHGAEVEDNVNGGVSCLPTKVGENINLYEVRMHATAPKRGVNGYDERPVRSIRYS